MLKTSAFSPEKLGTVKTIITHDSCPDGTASAIILKDAFDTWDRPVQVRFLQYGTAAYKELEPEPGMFFCDISPPAEKAKAFVDAGALILDHHKTARGVVEAFGENGVFGDEKTEPGVCGAVLAYRHVWKTLDEHFPRLNRESGDGGVRGQFIPEFAALAGIRDTWQRADSRWKEACIQANVLHFIPNHLWLERPFGEVAATWEKSFRSIGELLWDKNEKSVERTVRDAYRFTTAKGTRVVMFDGLRSSSDAAELLGSEADLVIGFMPTNEDGVPKYLFSTRSHTTFDCSAFAQAHGGGGHTKAAGFNVAINIETALNPYAYMQALLGVYEK